MKKLMIMGCCLLMFAGIDAQNIKPVEGFRNLKWGTSVEEAKKSLDLSAQENVGKITTFISLTDDHELGSIKLKEIYYFFHEQAGFFKVVLSGNGSDNDEMDAILKNRFGGQYETVLNPSHTHRVWLVGDVVANYKQQVSEDFSLTLRSDSIEKYHKSKNKVITDF